MERGSLTSKGILLVLVAGLLLASVAACGGGAPETPVPPVEQTPTVPPAPPVTRLPGTLYLLGSDVSTLDPHQMGDVGSAAIGVEIYSGLMKIVPTFVLTLPDGTVRKAYPEEDLFWDLHEKYQDLITKLKLGLPHEDQRWEGSVDGTKFSFTLTKDVAYTLEVVADIAESWDVSADGKVYTFHLRQPDENGVGGVYFHNGKLVTAEDFKWSLERACSPSLQLGGRPTVSPLADVYLGDVVGCRDKLNRRATEVAGVEVVDLYTLRFTIDAPRQYFLAKLTYPTAFVLDRENVATDKVNAPWTDHPVGTGPFRLERYKLQREMILVRNDFYYGQKPAVNRIIFDIAGGTPIVLYETDRLDVIGLGAQDIDRVKDPRDPLHGDLAVVEELSTFYIAFNVEKPPFDDPKVRRAFAMAVDWSTIVKAVSLGTQAGARGILPPGMPGYDPNLQGNPYDPARAQQLLAESKYGGVANFPKEIRLTYPGAGGANPDYLEAAQAAWKKNLGVEVILTPMPWVDFLDRLNQPENPFQMFSMGWIADYLDPQDFLEILFHSKSALNRTGYANPELDKVLDEAAVELDPGKRIALYQRAEQIIINDAVWMPVNHSRAYVLVKPWVERFLLPPMAIPRFQYVRLVEQAK